MSEGKSLIGDLIPIVGEKNVSDSIYERISYAQDSIQPDLVPEKIPLAVVKPKRAGSILLSTQGFTTIEMHEEDMYCELGAGVNLYKLEKLLLSRGYMLPMTMGSKFSATIGG